MIPGIDWDTHLQHSMDTNMNAYQKLNLECKIVRGDENACICSIPSS